MTTTEEIKKRAVVFEEGDALRAVAEWSSDNKLVSLELEIRGTDAMGVPRWQSDGFVMEHGAVPASNMWIACVLISRAERWLKENA